MDNPNDTENQEFSIAGPSRLNTTMTLSTPDIVSSCDLSSPTLDVNSIFGQREIEDIEVMSKITADETVDNVCPKTGSVESALNSTVVLSKAGSLQPVRVSQGPPQSPHIIEEDTGVTAIINFLPSLVPCHSTPITDLAECLKMVPELDLLVDEENDVAAELVLSGNCKPGAVRNPVFPSSNSIVNPYKLTGAVKKSRVESATKPKLGFKEALNAKKPLPNPSVSALRSSVAKPKLATLLSQGIYQSGSKKDKADVGKNYSGSSSKDKLFAKNSTVPGLASRTSKPTLIKTAEVPSSLHTKPTIKRVSSTNSLKPEINSFPSQTKKSVISASVVKSVPRSKLYNQRVTNSESGCSSGSSKSSGSTKPSTSASKTTSIVPKSGSIVSIKTADGKMSGKIKSDASLSTNKIDLKATSKGHITVGKSSLQEENKRSNKVLQKSVSSLSEINSSLSNSLKYTLSSSTSRVSNKSIEKTSIKGLVNNSTKSNIKHKNVLENSSKASSYKLATASSSEYRGKQSDSNSNRMTVSQKNTFPVKLPNPKPTLPRLTISSSFIAPEMTATPSLPPRSLSNVSSGSKQKSFSILCNQTPKPSAPSSSRLSHSGHSFRERKRLVPSPNSSQPDLVKTSTLRSDLQKEVVHLRSSLAAKIKEVNQIKLIAKDNINGFDALAIVVKTLLEKTEQVENLKYEADQVQGLKFRLEAFKNRNESLVLELDNSKLKLKIAEDEFNKLLHQLGEDIETMCKKHEEEKACMINKHRCQFDAQKCEHQEAMRKVKSRNVNDLTLLQEHQQEEILSLNRVNEMNLAKEKSFIHEKEAETQIKFKDEESKLLDKIQHLESKVTALVISLMNGPDHKDGAMAEMQKEIESLRAVVEMKKEKVKSINEEKLRMSQKLSTFGEMKEKVKSLSSQVEDMKELLDAKRTNERKLDAELQNLQESMKKQSRERRRLSMEKEQLEWKMRQGMPLQRCLMEENQSKSFSGETQHSSRNFKTFHIRSPSFDCSDPLPLEDCSPNPSSSTPSVMDYRTSRASVSYQLDLSGCRTPGSEARSGRKQRRLDIGLEDRL